MLVNVNAIRVSDGESANYSLEIDLTEFDQGMDANGVRETMDIIICQDCNVVDIDEVDLYTEAERVYQALQDLDESV